MAQQKEEQKKLLTEIMEADAKDGLYKQQTAVEWLFLMLNNPNRDQDFANKLFEQAKAMEKEHIKTAFIHGSYTGCGCYDYMEDVDADEYYNNTYGKDKPNNEKG